MTFPKNRARFAAILALGVVAAAVVPATAFAAPGDTVADGCFGFDALKGTITGYNDQGTGGAACSLDVTIPGTINGVTVTAIGAHAFAGIALGTVVIPDSVRTIEQSAFSNTGADTVKLGAGVKTIGIGAFSQNDLAVVSIPASVSSLGADAFAYNPLTAVSIDGDNLDVPTSAFNATDALSITDVTIGAGVRSLGDGLFGAQPVSKLTIDEGLESIGAGVFNGNRLRSVTIPSSVKTVGANAFDNGLIRTVSVGEGVQSIDNSAFLRNHIERISFDGNTTFSAELFSQNFTTDELQAALTSHATPAEAIAALNAKAELVKVFASNPDFLAAHGAGKVTDLSAVGGFAYGYVINPAAYTVASTGVDGAPLAPSARFTGVGLTDYLVKSALAAGIDGFHQIGDTVHVDPASIAGYTAPAAQEVVLTGLENPVTFAFTPDGTPQKGADDGEPAAPGDTPASTDGSATPATEDSSLIRTDGFDSTPLVVGGILSMLAGAGVLLARIRKARSA